MFEIFLRMMNQQLLANIEYGSVSDIENILALEQTLLSPQGV